MAVTPATTQKSAPVEITINVRCEACRISFATRVENEIFCPKCDRNYHYMFPDTWMSDRKLTIHQNYSEIRECLKQVSVYQFYFGRFNFNEHDFAVEQKTRMK